MAKEFILKNFIHRIDVIGHPEFVDNIKPTQRSEFNKKYDLKVVVFDSDIVFLGRRSTTIPNTPRLLFGHLKLLLGGL